MTYSNWLEEFKIKRQNIEVKLISLNLSKEQVISYFNYDNMVKQEPNFCLLYHDGKKCHNTENLNCYLCACPFFQFFEVPKSNIHSVCSIKSKFKEDFEYLGVTHCDCSNCLVPHKTGTINKYIT